VNCALVPKPTLNSAGPGAVTARVGLGTGSGNQMPAQFEIRLILRQGGARQLSRKLVM